jgi:hypothetical protein
MPPPFLQPSCALRSRFEAHELVSVKTSKRSSLGYFENLELIGDAAEGTLLRGRGDAV